MSRRRPRAPAVPSSTASPAVPVAATAPIVRTSRRAWGATLAVACGWLALLFALDRALPPPLPDAGGGAVVLAADADGVWRYPVRIDQVSPHYLQALTTYEDRWFRWHPGVNPFALARAGWQWATTGDVVSGGSTLSMQAARIIDPHPRTAGGKLR